MPAPPAPPALAALLQAVLCTLRLATAAADVLLQRRAHDALHPGEELQTTQACAQGNQVFVHSAADPLTFKCACSTIQTHVGYNTCGIIPRWGSRWGGVEGLWGREGRGGAGHCCTACRSPALPAPPSHQPAGLRERACTRLHVWLATRLLASCCRLPYRGWHRATAASSPRLGCSCLLGGRMSLCMGSPRALVCGLPCNATCA